MADLRPLHEWTGPPGTLVAWLPAPETLDRVRDAASSDVPPSYQQEQHLRAYRACERDREELARLVIVTWQVPGTCNLGILDEVINAHVRRHDTYRSWFQYGDDGSIVRRVVEDAACLRLVAHHVGEVSDTEWRAHVSSTPSPFAWDCFRFGVVQHPDAFTFFGCVDHLHTDASLVTILFEEIHERYRALRDGAEPTPVAETGRYLDFCANQRQWTSTLTLADARVAAWIDFLHEHDGQLPRFPLPLGDMNDRCLAEHVTVDVLDAAGAARFESACVAAGGRVTGGLLACAAMTERALVGARRYSVVTPTNLRKTAADGNMSGWCTGVVPISIDVDGEAFGPIAVAAQRCFGRRRGLADVPIERVLELARPLPTIGASPAGGVMLSYMDTNLRPFKPEMGRGWHELNGHIFINPGVAGQVSLWFFRSPGGLSLTAAYPANDTARASMARYLNAIGDACRRIA